MKSSSKMQTRQISHNCGGIVTSAMVCFMLLVLVPSPQAGFQLVQTKNGFQVGDALYQNRDLAAKASEAMVSWHLFRQSTTPKDEKDRETTARLLREAIEADSGPTRKAILAYSLGWLYTQFRDPATGEDVDKARGAEWYERVLEWCPEQERLLRRKALLRLADIRFHERGCMHAIADLQRLFAESRSLPTNAPAETPNDRHFRVKAPVDRIIVACRRASLGTALYALHRVSKVEEEGLAKYALLKLANARLPGGAVNPLELPLVQFR